MRLSRYLQQNKVLSACLGTGLTASIAFSLYGLCAPMGHDGEGCIYIDHNTSATAIRQQVADASSFPQQIMFEAMARLTGYYSHVYPGRYDVAGTSTIGAFRQMRGGSETPLRLTIPSTLRTTEDLCDFLGMHLMPSTDDFYQALTDSATLATYGLDKETATTLFLPNTYEVYWSQNVGQVLDRMQHEAETFWTTDGRDEKREKIAGGLSRADVITLASIVEQETQNAGERPAVAGMYVNRLLQHMPLQADPTIKFALKDFGLKRIMHTHLDVDSPYNTYRNTGLPPGPICLPSLSSINAVLNYQHHDYLYMCAKEDFSGTHNFAVTYAEHLRNAARYADALNKHGIK